jgi:hypothetical protein
MKNKLFAMPLFDADASATAAATDSTSTAEVSADTPSTDTTTPKTNVELLAEANAVLASLEALNSDAFESAKAAIIADIAALEAKIKEEEAAAEAAINTAEAAIETVATGLITIEQTFCQKHAIAVGAINTWLAVIGGIVVLKLIGVI